MSANERSPIFAAKATRRQVLATGALLAGGLSLASMLDACGGSPQQPAQSAATPARGRGEVLVRTPGGSYEDAWRKASWEPFTAATGIEVKPVATDSAKIQAMVQAGNVQLDVVDLGEFQTVSLSKKGYLLKLDPSVFKLTNARDLPLLKPYYVGNIAFSTVLGYSTQAFKNGHPTSWPDFWDAVKFPGPRTLEGYDAGSVNLEFALLADGVAMDKLYPLDLDRAFRKLGQIRKSVTKFWNSGAISAQLFSDQQVVLGAVWNGRLQTLIDGGAPLAIEWNQAQRLNQGFSILKGAPNVENAQRLIDYSMQPAVLAKFAQMSGYGPLNLKAYDHLEAKIAANLPTSSEHLKSSFQMDAEWWVSNSKAVSDRWQEFLLGG